MGHGILCRRRHYRQSWCRSRPISAVITIEIALLAAVREVVGVAGSHSIVVGDVAGPDRGGLNSDHSCPRQPIFLAASVFLEFAQATGTTWVVDSTPILSGRSWPARFISRTFPFRGRPRTWRLSEEITHPVILGAATASGTVVCLVYSSGRQKAKNQ